MNNDAKSQVYWKDKVIFKNSQSNPIYGLGVVGALFYFLQQANNFTEIILGIGKSIFWPAFLMYKLLSYIKL